LEKKHDQTGETSNADETIKKATMNLSDMEHGKAQLVER